jgi:hypothetical protein
LEKSTIKNCLLRCLFELASSFRQTGFFPATRVSNGVTKGTSDTLFVTMLILVMLAGCREFIENDWPKKALDALEKNKSAVSTWNYWRRDSSSYLKEPYPDDMDDTFMALMAFALWQPEKTAGWEKDIEKLFPFQPNAARLYRTWIGIDAKENDADIIVNATVLLYLKTAAKEHDGLRKVMTRICSRSNRLGSKYYSSPAYMSYWLAKAGIRTAPLLEKAAAPCEAAFLASARMTLGDGDKKKIDALMKIAVIEDDPSLPYPIYRERVHKDGSAVLISSSALSLTARAEACALYLKKYGQRNTENNP